MARPDAQSGWKPLFWKVFRQSRNAMAVLDDRRNHVEVNGAYLKLSGSKRAELIGKPIDRFIVDQPPLDQWRAALAKGDAHGEREVVRADGTGLWVQFAAHPEIVTGKLLVLVVVVGTSPGRRAGRSRRHRRRGQALSEREREIVHLVALGHSGPEIAAELHITHDTVRTHIRNAMAKVHARSRAQLVAKSLGGGLVAA